MNTLVGSKMSFSTDRVLANIDEQLIKNSHRKFIEYTQHIITTDPVFLSLGMDHSKLHLSVEPRATVYLASLLAEPFGNFDADFITQATFACLCLDGFSQIVDDITDNSSSQVGALTHVSSILLGKAAQRYALLTGGNELFWYCWERYLEEASEAEKYLWKYRNRISTFEANDFTMMGQKSALINMSAALYASKTNKWEILDAVEAGLKKVAVGIQIMDDLFDWEEDEKAGINTYPLFLAKQHINSTTSLSESINSNVVLLNVLVAAKQYLTQAKNQFAPLGANSMIDFINLLIKNLNTGELYIYQLPSIKPAEYEVPKIKHLHKIIVPSLNH